MALNNSQYDTIMRRYQRIQALHRHEQADRIAEVFAKLPELQEIDQRIASESIASGRRLLSGEEESPQRLREIIDRLAARRRQILTDAGYPEDYLELDFTCPMCHDTGYIGNQKCQCFKKAEIDLLYTQSNLQGILEEENFSVFSLDYYSDEITDPSGKVTSRERARRVLETCLQFVRNFDSEFANLFFYGDTGVGKTFLSHCIARELLNTTHSVIYFSAQEFFDHVAERHFHQHSGSGEDTGYLYDCDLLIIDDLGTELTNSFVNAALFSCINERLSSRKSTIISTNLPLDSFANVYSERVFSRISNGYTMLKLFGQDIRVQKKLRQLSEKKSLNK